MFKVLFILASLLLVGCSFFDEGGKAKRIDELNQKINQIRKQISDERTQALNLDTESQPLMYAEWDDYTKKLDQEKKKEDLIHTLESEVEKLEIEKKQLEQQK